MTETIGRLCDQSAIRRLQLDDVVFTYVVDGTMGASPEAVFPVIPQQFWADNAMLLDDNHLVAMSTGGLLVERNGHRLLIDAGIGNLTLDSDICPIACGDLPNTLAALDVAPEDIDAFALTHVHVDHAGWAFVIGDDGVWRRTFPNARYVVAEKEWEPLSRGELPPGTPDSKAVVEPLGHVLTPIHDGDEVAPGVTAVVTPGHSAGHTSYIIETCRSRRLVAFGDVFHVPAQLAHPEWTSVQDFDTVQVPAARARMLRELAQPNTFGFAIHFGDQPFGSTATGPHGLTVWDPLPTTELLPNPRAHIKKSYRC